MSGGGAVGAVLGAGEVGEGDVGVGACCVGEKPVPGTPGAGGATVVTGAGLGESVVDGIVAGIVGVCVGCASATIGVLDDNVGD